MRRVGVEPRPDLVQVVPKGGSDSGPSEKKDERGGEDDDTHKDDNEHHEGSSSESQIPPPPESSESHSLEDQPLNNAKACYLAYESTHGENNVTVVVDEILRRHAQMIFVSCLMLGMKEKLVHIACC